MPAPINMTAHVLPDLNQSLISIGKLCDAGCTATFDAQTVTIHHEHRPILTGTRQQNGLWLLPMQQSLWPRNQQPPIHALPAPAQQANFTMHDAVLRDSIKFLHLTLFSPTKSTLLAAIRNNHFVGWPGLTEHNVKRYLTLQEPTIMGHMDQQRQGTRSTSRNPPTPQPTIDNTINDSNPAPFGDTTNPHTDGSPAVTTEHPNDYQTRTHHAYLSVQDLPSGRVFTDQTGPFPVVSTQGTKAVMVLYDYDSNAILIEGITSRGKAELLRAYTHLLGRLHQAGLKPTLQRMDNEISEVFKQFLLKQNITLELTPAHVHRRNAAERAIRTWKNHFLAGLASLNPRFPIQYWSYLLPQSELTLNLLRQSRINPRLSAHAQLHGHYNFPRTPMAPPGCEMIAFQPPTQRPSWGFHGFKAWYVRPALNHYRCVHAINAATGRETTVENLQFLPHNFTSPVLSPPQLVTIAAQQLIDAIRAHTHPPRQLFRPNNTNTAALRHLAEIFHRMANPNQTAQNTGVTTQPLLSAPTDPPALPRVNLAPPGESIPNRPTQQTNTHTPPPAEPPAAPEPQPHVITQPDPSDDKLIYK